MQRIFAPFALLLLALTLSAPGVELPSAAKGKDALAPKAKPETDAGAKDPADFPRAPGLVRRSYSVDPGKTYDTEIATYHAKAGMDEVAAHYLEQLQTAGWKKGSDSVSGSDVHRLRMIEWRSPVKEAEVRFYAARGDGSDLRVRIFTYKKAPAPNQAASGSGAPAKDISAVKTAPAAQANAVKTDGSAEKFGGAPVGPAPTNFQVKSWNPYSHNLSWSCDAGATCDVYRVDSTGRTLVANKIQVRGMLDHAYLEPNTVYRVVVHYRDGREGSLDYTYANPPQPGVVTGLKAVQTGPGKVSLTWQQSADRENSYQIYGPALPAEGRRVDTTSAELTDVPVGNHGARVTILYGSSDKMAPAPKGTMVEFTVLTDRDRYRIVFLGLQCLQETKDDMLNLDGKHDEVYAGAYIARVTRDTNNAPPAPGSFVRTKVMGDTNGFPDRLRTGTASDAGGIQTGDFVPSSAAVALQPGVATTNDRFPLLVWEGELRDSSDLLVIAPVLFSWNKAGEGPWNTWSGWWSTPNGSSQLRRTARLGVRTNNFGVILSEEWQNDVTLNSYIGEFYGDPMSQALNPLDPNRKRRYGPHFTMNGDRPIGLEDQNASGSVFGVPSLFWVPFGFVLTRANLEAKLGNNNAVLYQRLFIDDKLTNASLGGNYSLYIQIERLAPPP